MFTGSPCEESRRPLEDLHVLPQPPVLPPQLRQLLTFLGGQATVADRPGIPPGLLHPFADRGLGQVEVAGDLADRPVPALAQLDDLGLELRGKRAALPGLLAPHALHSRTSFRGQTPDDGCPSKRVRLTCSPGNRATTRSGAHIASTSPASFAAANALGPLWQEVPTICSIDASPAGHSADALAKVNRDRHSAAKRCPES